MKTRFKFLLFAIFFAIFFAFCFCHSFFLYPKKFEKEILASAKEFRISPALVFAVIKVESGFNPSAISSAGAVGLMQVMPSTAKWLGFEDNLFNPAINIKAGCKYLAYLQEIFLDETTVLAAYNAGPNKVKVWIEDERYGQASRTLRKTPYKETNDYIKRVQHAKKVYEFLNKFQNNSNNLVDF